MEQHLTVPLGHPQPDQEATFTLEEAREKLRTLLPLGKRNAWEIGDLLNRIEKSGLVRAIGYTKTRSWLEAELPESKDKTSSLYRYANVASVFTQADVDRWGIAKLYCLMIHEGEALQNSTLTDLAEREVRLHWPDGSITAKPFRYCTCQQLRLSQRCKTASSDRSPRKVRGTQKPASSEPLQPATAHSRQSWKERIARVAQRTRKIFWPFAVRNGP